MELWVEGLVVDVCEQVEGLHVGQGLADQAVGFVGIGGEVEGGHFNAGEGESGQEWAVLRVFFEDGFGVGVAYPFGLGGTKGPLEDAAEGFRCVGDVEV